MKNVIGVGESAHVTASNFRNMLIGILGKESYIFNTGECLATTLVSNNQLDIGTGMIFHNGTLSVEEKGASVAITNGTQGMKRIDLVVNRYQRDEATQIETNEWVCIIGTPDTSSPVAPAHTVGDVMNDDLIDDCPVFQITLDGLNVTEVKCLLPIMKNVSEKQNQITGGTAEPTGGEDNDVYVQYE